MEVLGDEQLAARQVLAIVTAIERERLVTLPGPIRQLADRVAMASGMRPPCPVAGRFDR